MFLYTHVYVSHSIELMLVFSWTKILCTTNGFSMHTIIIQFCKSVSCGNSYHLFIIH